MKTQWDTVKSDPRVKFIALMPIKKIGSISYYYLEEIPINSRTQNWKIRFLKTAGSNQTWNWNQ